MRKLDPDDIRPPYAQVAGAIRGEIADGALKPGEKLPNHKELAARYGVAVGTVKRALGELQGAGLVVSRQGQGAFVRTRPDRVDVNGADGTIQELRDAVAALAARLAEVERQLAGR